MRPTTSKSPSGVEASLEQTSFVVASGAMTELLAMAEAAAKSSGTVLITGETGVGKGVVARYTHSPPSRRRAAFVGVNCAGLTQARLETELFGHVDGDTTSACPDRRGKFRLAHRGTLFLDEIGDMRLRTQARRARRRG